MSNMKQQIAKVMAELYQEIQEVEGLPTREKLRDEIAIAATRLKGVKLVLDGDAGQLEQYIQGFDLAMGEKRALPGSGPPCRNYTDLQVFSVLEQLATNFDTCENKKAIESVNKQIGEKKKPISSLSAAATAALTELRKAKAAHTARKDGMDSAKTDGAKRGAHKYIRGDVFEHLDEVPEMLRITTATELKEVDWKSCTVPTLVTAQAMDGHEHVTDFFNKEACEGFSFFKTLAADFAKEEAKSQRATRVTCPIDDALVPRAVAVLSAAVPSDAIRPTDSAEKKQLREALQPCAFVVSAGKVFAQAEKHHFGVVKWTWSGTRQVAVTREESFLQFVQARSAPGQLLPLALLWTTWKDITADYMQHYMAKQGKGNTFHSTVAPGDLLFTPPAFIIAERSKGATTLGLRVGILRPPDYNDLAKVLSVVERGTGGAAAAASGSAPALAPMPKVKLRLAVEEI